ncbi:hypothetical protein F4604DRAFT_1678398 [Suillus subluteus]|nr:hypothetical protein F4604DRAFT_1678398 [Suillus subluteus]
MDGIQAFQQQLIEQKNGIIESINLHNKLVSPLCLPTEVLSQIFCHCLPQIRGPEGLDLPSKLIAPMLLTRICRRWRDIAVGMPNLWCKLYVEVDDGNWQQAAFFYDSWLKRARGRPLSLKLQFYADDHWTKLQCLLQPYVNRISSLCVDLCHHDAPELNMFTDFPVLEEMLVFVNDDISGGDAAVPASISRSFSQLPPTLNSFAVSGLLFGFDDLSSCNPLWAQLTTLEIEIWQPDGVLHLLRLAPNLSSLTIIALFDNVQALTEPFTHTKLQILQITCESSFNTDPPFCDLLNALSLPTLRVLAIRDVPEWPHEEFKAFLVRSECSLESLNVLDGVVTDEQRAEYAALVPSLSFSSPYDDSIKRIGILDVLVLDQGGWNKTIIAAKMY